MEPIKWTGDLDDDCTAQWNGLMLRCEMMDDSIRGRRKKSDPSSFGTWWWCVYDESLPRGQSEVASSNDLGSPLGMTAAQARYACECAAKAHLYDKEHQR